MRTAAPTLQRVFARRRLAGGLLLLAALAALLPWSFGLVQFVQRIPRTVDDVQSHTEAIVVLTGGSERLATGFRLLAERKAERVFISGVDPRVDAEKLVQLAGRPAASLADRVETGHGARDTQGNAEETAAWMQQHGYHSLRLVTGGYHMPRSLLEFAHALPDAVIIPHPVFPERVKHATWWRRPGTAMLIITEYNKYLLAHLSHLLQRRPAGGERLAVNR